MPTYLSPGVYMEEVSSGSKPIEGVGTAVAAFVGFTEKGPANTPVLVTNWTQYTQTFGDFVEGTYLAHSVYGFFLNGGGSAYVVRIGANGDSAEPIATAALPAGKDASGKEILKPPYVVRALAPGAAGDELSVEITDASEPSDETFKLVVKRGNKVEETFDGLTTKRGGQNVATVVKNQSKLITLEEVKGANLPAVLPKGRVALAGGALPEPVQRTVSANEYVGNSADRTGFAGLEALDDVTMLAVPDLMTAYQQGMLDDEGLKAVQLAMIAHCELMSDRVAILDAPPGLNAQQVKDWRVNFAGYDSKYATLYWPWIKVMDPVAGRPVHVPPSGHMAGIWARNDGTRGVHNNWVVFEPNDPKLWDSVKRTLNAFLRGLWRNDMLFGRTPGEAFFVKCDEENNPADSRDAGYLIVDIGIAPVKPAEFVVFRISQTSAGAEE